jgi:hypothetical protein
VVFQNIKKILKLTKITIILYVTIDKLYYDKFVFKIKNTINWYYNLKVTTSIPRLVSNTRFLLALASSCPFRFLGPPPPIAVVCNCGILE